MNGYKECFEAVMRGRKVTLAVNFYTTADFYCGPIVGKENGLYDCWLQSEGRDYPTPFFKLRTFPEMDNMPRPCEVPEVKS